MAVAHRLGLASTATMMFGHVETVEERIEHLERVRAQQDKSRAGVSPAQTTQAAEPSRPASSNASGIDTGADGTPALLWPGFTAFIAWTFQAENTRLKAPTVGAHEYLRMQALGRIYLDNIPNIQSSWVTQGPDIGQVALKFGANDFGSVMMEENVVSSAGTTFRLNAAQIESLIRDAGYEPRRRNNWYELLN